MVRSDQSYEEFRTALLGRHQHPSTDLLSTVAYAWLVVGRHPAWAVRADADRILRHSSR
jgi:hypothetical protein